LSTRYHIEEIVHQDASGIIFHALDTETSRHVALQRFFPFGWDGGGLEHEELTAYQIAIGRLSGITHPAMRSVSAGGCDPVDGMPYIVMEWVEGTSLLSLIERGPLQPHEVVLLIMQALEVSLLVSEILADEAIWVDTGLESILLGNEDSGRDFVFAISPMKWLGSEGVPRGLDDIVTLAEQAVHWHGKLVSDSAGGGLGGWIKWLKGASATTSIHEAMETLAAATGSEPPKTVALIVANATNPANLTNRVKHSHFHWWMVAALIVLVAGLAYMRLRPETVAANASEQRHVSTAAPVPKQPDAVKRATELAARLSEELAIQNASQDQRRQELSKPGAAYEITDAALLLENVGKEAVLEGTFAGTRQSKSRLYIEFSKPAPSGQPRGVILRPDMKPNTQPDQLASLVGKRIRIRGIVRAQTLDIKGKKVTRPELRLKGRQAIEVVE